VKILVEAMCADFGGIRTYVEHLLRVWPDEFPLDDVHVMVREGSDLPVDPRLTRHDIRVRRPGTAGRPLAQSVHLPRLARQLGVDVVLATLPSTTVRRPSVPMAVVIYDLRHELRPQQFSASSRVLRAVSYRRGYALADGFISISQRSLTDLHDLHPRTARVPGIVAHLGADHVDTWERPPVAGPAVTFAHHSNKNLDLILDGWQRVLTTRPGSRLKVLGLGAAAREALAPRLRESGLTDGVTLAPFVPDDEFRQVFAGAGLILFPSDFEGFGLPVAESMRLGIPVVIGPEKATQEVAGGHAFLMTDWSPQALATAVGEARGATPEPLEAARKHAAIYTWGATAHRTREMLAGLVAGQRASSVG
jgi:glycosyltransferase involved in cell wall biosynthesis